MERFRFGISFTRAVQCPAPMNTPPLLVVSGAGAELCPAPMKTPPSRRAFCGSVCVGEPHAAKLTSAIVTKAPAPTRIALEMCPIVAHSEKVER